MAFRQAASPNRYMRQFGEECGRERGKPGEICSSSGPFDIPPKNAPIERLRRWRKAALVLNASRRFRYTPDLKEEEKDQIRRKIRAHAQVIRAAFLFKEAGERERLGMLGGLPKLPTDGFGIGEEQLTLMTRDHDYSALQEYGGHRHSQTETSSDGEDEYPTTSMAQNPLEEVSQYHDHTGNNPLDQVFQPQDLRAETIGRDAPEPDDDNREINNLELDELRRIEVEEMKFISKFSFFSTGISIAGIISILSGYLGEQMGRAHTVPFKVCIFFMAVTFTSGASMLFLILFGYSSRIPIKFIRGLFCIILLFLFLASFSVSYLFLKMLTILAFVPPLIIITTGLIMVRGLEESLPRLFYRWLQALAEHTRCLDQFGV